MQQQPIQQSSQSEQTGQIPYQEPPKMITTKDHLYLNDMLSWNLLAMKKAHFFAQQCQDQEIKQAIEKAGMMHQQHYETILSHLQPNQQQQTMPMQ
ncbi:hypothetical protein [Bacillus sp. FJAT-45037]|uniref:hypothetical protein n=1 Tax=Bacillus sp. FJAT-45037 TaxID=2011007 RepID=UPI0018E231AF|nr:hypothetical protein [Bacillus sp. FJAT-45037]